MYQHTASCVRRFQRRHGPALVADSSPSFSEASPALERHEAWVYAPGAIVACSCRYSKRAVHSYAVLVPCSPVLCPQEALLSVSQRLLGEQELGGSAVAAAVARTCVDVHTSAVEAAERYHQELRRRWGERERGRARPRPG